MMDKKTKANKTLPVENEFPAWQQYRGERKLAWSITTNIG
jgi:hypothetical protein